jgi:hypothetical protein
MKIMKWQSYVLCLILTVWGQIPAHAGDLWILNEQLTIQRTDNNLRIDRTLNSQGFYNDEFARGNDLSRAVKDMVQKLKDSVALLKGRQVNQIRATEISRIAQSNAQDTMRRNEVTQKIQQDSQRVLVQDLKTKNNDLTQRVKDLSRR